MKIERKNGIIVALDVMEKKKALEIAEKVGHLTDAIKVGYPLVLNTSMDVLNQLSDFGNIIADFKIADIPYVSEIISKKAFESGADGVIIHGFTGSDVIEACVRVAERYDGDVFVVTELSSAGGQEFMAKHSVEIVRLAEKSGADGIVAPATRPDRIREFRRISKKLKILCPGVGAQGGIIKDVFDAGGDFAIVGRSIYQAEEPDEALKQLIRELD